MSTEKEKTVSRSNSIRKKLVEKGLNRDRSAEFTKKISKNKIISIQADGSIKPITKLTVLYPARSLGKILTPVRQSVPSMKTIPTTPSSTLAKNPIPNPNEKIIRADYTQTLYKTLIKYKNITKEVLDLVHITRINLNPKTKELTECIINILKASRVGSTYSKELYLKIQQLGNCLGLCLMHKKKKSKDLKEDWKVLNNIAGKFTVRTIAETRVILADSNLYLAFLIFIGHLNRKSDHRPASVCEVMEKFVSNPGLAIKTIRKIPLISKDSIDKGIFYIDSLIRSYTYFKTTKQYTQNDFNFLLITLLNHLYSQNNISQSQVIEKLKISVTPNSNTLKKTFGQILLPIRLSSKKLSNENCINTEIIKIIDPTNQEKTEVIEEMQTFMDDIELNLEKELVSNNISVDIKEIDVSSGRSLSNPYRTDKDCKKMLLSKFFEKRRKDCSIFNIKNYSDFEFSDRTEISDNERPW